MSAIDSSLSRRSLNHPSLAKESPRLENNLLELGLLGNRARKKTTNPKSKPKTVEFGSTVAYSN